MNTLRYWSRLARLFHHYRKGSSVLSYLPVRMWVELTSYCNYRCIMCPNKDLHKDQKGYMEWDLYQKIIDESKHFVFDINLAHRGESLLHPQIVEMIEYAKQSHLFTRLHTNGSLLTEKLASQIISSGLDRISFSFDGYDKETYEKIRKGGDFHKTLNNILRFLELKKQAQSKLPRTAIEVIDFNQEHSSSQARENFKDQFKDLPLDDFVMKEMHNWAGEIQKKKESQKYSVCPFPWNALIIYWDGAVLPCTQDFFGTYVVGNAQKSSLREIWNSPRMVDLRKNLAAQNIQSFQTCSQCDRVWRKGFLGIPKQYIWKFISKKMP
ncbi:SPASM domain-containing protein [bacterium]|nr:SPASM domain-containing protein [bacterium]